MCTGVRFSDEEGNMYFGRNLDWSFSYGESILATPRGYHYDNVFGASGKATPNAVIGVGVVMADRPMYFDCANEHGLAIAGLNFPGYAEFVHEPVEGTDNVATFEFPLWVARNFDSVDEVEEALKNVTLVSQIVPGQQESLLHWIIGDSERSIVVEQMADGMHVHHDDVDVLTNQPTFGFHMENLRNYMCVGNEMAEPATWGKASVRLGRGCEHARHPGRCELPVPLRSRGLHQHPLPTAGRRTVQRIASVPYSRFRADGGRHGEDGQRPVRTHAVHQRLFVQDQHVLYEHV